MYCVLTCYLFFLALILVYNFLQLNLLFNYLRKKKPASPPALDPDQPPLVTVQLPLYNEQYVAGRLIDNIAALDYPLDRLEIQLLDDSNDQTTRICEEKSVYYRQQGMDMQVLRRAKRVGFKAGALAAGLTMAKGEFIAIFDADFLPKPDFLQQTLPHFHDPLVGVVQTRWTHLNENYSIFAKLQALQLNVHFTIEQMGRKAGNHFLQFNGTAGVWRKKAIEAAGGWQADTLTEDLDLSFRAQLHQWRIVYLEQVEAPAELPVEMDGIKSQQFRWMKGGAENARRLSPLILKSNLRLATKLHAIAHLFNSSIFLFVFLLALSSVALLPFVSSLTWVMQYLWVSLLGMVGVAAVYFFANIQLLPRPLTAKNLFALILYFPLLLTMSMGLSLHNSIAVIEGYLGIKSSFIRTPKYNIIGGRKSISLLQRRKKPLSFTVLLEGCLALLFTAALVLGVRLDQYAFLVFHFMLAAGFASIFVASWREH